MTDTGELPATDSTITAPDKYRVVFENDRVRVLEYRDEPGQRVSQVTLEAVFSQAGAPVEADVASRRDRKAFAVRVPDLDSDERREVRAEANRLHDQLKAQLSPEIWQLVYRYGDACRKEEIVSELNMMDMMVDALAAHFPGQAPMIRCLRQHILDTDFGMSDDCGLVEARKTA